MLLFCGITINYFIIIIKNLLIKKDIFYLDPKILIYEENLPVVFPGSDSWRRFHSGS
jgi:hypothetical protein